MMIEEIAFVIKDLILPLVTLLMVAFSIFIVYKRKLLTTKVEPLKKKKDEVPHIVGNNNTIHFTPSEMQKQLAYDVNRFDEYHQHSISQSKISFWFSLIFASIGFMIIATSVFAYESKSGYIGIIAGTIIDAVSALFFYQSNKARQLMSEFFDRLRSDRKLEESLKLCESIENEILRSSLQVKLSLYFAGVNDSDAIAKEIMHMANSKVSPEEVSMV